jgi:hypothetical protein
MEEPQTLDDDNASASEIRRCAAEIGLHQRIERVRNWPIFENSMPRNALLQEHRRSWPGVYVSLRVPIEEKSRRNFFL